MSGYLVLTAIPGGGASALHYQEAAFAQLVEVAPSMPISDASSEASEVLAQRECLVLFESIEQGALPDVQVVPLHGTARRNMVSTPPVGASFHVGAAAPILRLAVAMNSVPRPSLSMSPLSTCSAIIASEQAALVAALRARRAPAVTAPRIVNGPTLLSGIVGGGMPDRARGMTIAPGQRGR